MRIDATLACAAFSLCLGAWPVHAVDVTAPRMTAASIANAGNGRGSPACVSCHGANGEGNPLTGFPRLAGLPAGYIERQLENFAGGKRVNAIMTPIAQILSTDERQNIADYYAKIATRGNHEAAQSTSPNAASLIPGEILAVRGRWSEDLPACSQCHGSGGHGAGDTFPPLAGQPTLYIENQLRAWQSGTRDPGPMELMGGIAKKLSADDVKAVAAYLSALPLRGHRDTKQSPHMVPSTAASAPRPAVMAAPAERSRVTFSPPEESDIPKTEFGDMVRLGEQIFQHPKQFAPAYVGNSLRCSSCHLDAGRKAHSAPLWAAYVAYPEYRAKNKKVNTFEERLQGCFQYSMNGKAPPLGDPTLVALESYAYWMATGAPINPKLPGRGYPKLPNPEMAPNYGRGRAVYQRRCTLCHGTSGGGRQANDGSMVFPALWGDASFNWGAGMSSIDNAAAFIKTSMPLSQANSLSDQEAWDVAAYMDSHERPQDPRYVESVEATRLKFHDSAESMYGVKVDGHVLGQGSTKPGGVLRKGT